MSRHFSTTSEISKVSRAAPRLAARHAMAAAGNEAIARLLAGQRAGLSAHSASAGSNLQRVAVRELGALAGNRAVNGLFGPDSGRPAVQRAWEDSTDSDFAKFKQWDVLMGGALRWYRWEHTHGVSYLFKTENKSALGDDEEADYDEMLWRTAEEWKKWKFASQFWSDELTKAPQVKAELEELDSSSSEEDLPEIEVSSARGADPNVTSVRAPDWAPRGAFSWPVKMTIGQPQAASSWVVQKIDVQDPDGRIVFWEAFPVAPGATLASNEDIYQDNARKDFGYFAIQGRMQHHSFGGAPPAGMSLGAVKEADDYQYTSYKEPPFWVEGEGAQHDLTFEWLNKRVLKKFETVPDGGEPVFKESYQHLGTG